MLDDTARTPASADNLAALTTLSACGQPQTQIMWVDRDEDHLVVTTEVGRQRFGNGQYDPRVAITIWDKSSPCHYAEVRRRVVDKISGPEARAHIDTLSEKYTQGPWEPDHN